MAIVLNVLSTEILKMKRTLGLWLAIIAPLGVAGFECLLMWSQGEMMIDFAGENIWGWHAKYNLTIWGLLMLPLFVTLETALLAGWEHRNQTWKILYTQPIPRWMLLTSKQFSGLALIGLSQFILYITTIGTGLLLHQVRPDLGFTSSVPWIDMFWYNGIIFWISLLILSIHSFVALHWHNFTTAMAVGIIATMSGVFFVYSDYAPYYPWAMAGLIANELLEKGFPWIQVGMGVAGGSLIYLLGCFYLTRKEVF